MVMPFVGPQMEAPYCGTPYGETIYTIGPEHRMVWILMVVRPPRMGPRMIRILKTLTKNGYHGINERDV